MPDQWSVIPAALQRARLALLLKAEELAKKSGVSVRSIRRYESTEQRVSLETLKCLAKALSAEVKDLARLGPSGRAKPESAPPSPDAGGAQTSPLPPRTQLEACIDLERAAKVDPAPVATSAGLVPILTAKRLQDVFTAFALHDGARFFLAGTVDTQRGVLADEAKLLASTAGVCARFHIVKQLAENHHFGVTVHAARKEHTARLQALHGKEARLLVRVHVVPGDRAEDGVGFTSFITKVTSKRPWTFVVEEVLGAAEDAPAKPRREGRRAAK